MNLFEFHIKETIARINWRWVNVFLAFVLITSALHVWNHPHNLEVSITASLPPGAKSTLYHAKVNKPFKDSRSIPYINENANELTQVFNVRTFFITGQVRWDPMEHVAELNIKRVEVSNDINRWVIEAPNIRLSVHQSNQIEWLNMDASNQRLTSLGVDPFLVWRLPKNFQDIPVSVWIKHVMMTVLLAGLLTGIFALAQHGLKILIASKGPIWIARSMSQTLGLASLVLSAGHLSLQHGWWTWGLVLQANERDGIRQALPPLIQDAKSLLQRIDTNIPVALSSQWRENYFNYYAAEEYLYPRRLADQAPLQLNEKGFTADPRCQPILEYGTAVLLHCHD